MATFAFASPATATWKVEKKRKAKKRKRHRSVHPLPADLREALMADSAVLDAWKDITPPGAQRVHLLGRGRKAAGDPRAPHSQDAGGAGGRPAPALLLAGVQAPRSHRQLTAKVLRKLCCGRSHLEGEPCRAYQSLSNRQLG
jgi:hypothetical protein